MILGIVIGIIIGGLLCMGWAIFKLSKMKW